MAHSGPSIMKSWDIDLDMITIVAGCGRGGKGA